MVARVRMVRMGSGSLVVLGSLIDGLSVFMPVAGGAATDRVCVRINRLITGMVFDRFTPSEIEVLDKAVNVSL